MGGCQVFEHVSGLLVVAFPGEQVGKEEELEHGEQDEQLDEYDGPKRPSEGHLPEAVDVESDDVAQHLHGFGRVVVPVKYTTTRPISDGFRKNNVNYWAFREIRSIIPHL